MYVVGLMGKLSSLCARSSNDGTYVQVGPTSILLLYLYFCQHLILDLVN